MMLKVFRCISFLIYLGSPFPFLKKDSHKRRVFRRHQRRYAICFREEGRFLLICAISNKMWPGKPFFFSGEVQINHKGYCELIQHVKNLRFSFIHEATIQNLFCVLHIYHFWMAELLLSVIT